MAVTRIRIALVAIAMAGCQAIAVPSAIDEDRGADERAQAPAAQRDASPGHDRSADAAGGDAAPSLHSPRDGGSRDGGSRDGRPAQNAGGTHCVAPEDAGLPTPRALPGVLPPAVLGVLVGPAAEQPVDLHLHGTDLGFSFVHDDELILMFGDTLRSPSNTCVEELNDDAIASLPLRFDGSVPKPVFSTKPDAPHEFSPVRLMRGDVSLPLGFAQAPLTGFSDGEHAVAMFDRLELPRCVQGVCAADGSLSCSTRIGECQPPSSTLVPALCDVTTGLGCFAAESCVAADVALCVDHTSSQYDGSVQGEVAAAAGIVEWSVQRKDEQEVFDSVLSFRTNKFMSATSRTIERLGDTKDCNDYSPGHNALLVWGRPRYSSQGGREARLYLMAHSLPLELDADRQLRFAPRYFAGVDPDTNEPFWSPRQDQAKPLALDGLVNGDPHEPLAIVDHTAISWLGAPVNKWIMLYGGGVSSLLLPNTLREDDPNAGAVVMRFADHPWGPWSLPEPHLIPGSPQKPGDPYGPSGFLYHPDCRDTETEKCAIPDAMRRSWWSNEPRCGINYVLWDQGQLYGANIIDPYTAPNERGGLDVIWSVSTWNPYSVVLLRTSIGDVR